VLRRGGKVAIIHTFPKVRRKSSLVGTRFRVKMGNKPRKFSWGPELVACVTKPTFLQVFDAKTWKPYYQVTYPSYFDIDEVLYLGGSLLAVLLCEHLVRILPSHQEEKEEPWDERQENFRYVLEVHNLSTKSLVLCNKSESNEDYFHLHKSVFNFFFPVATTNSLYFYDLRLLPTSQVPVYETNFKSCKVSEGPDNTLIICCRKELYLLDFQTKERTFLGNFEKLIPIQNTRLVGFRTPEGTLGLYDPFSKVETIFPSVKVRLGPSNLGCSLQSWDGTYLLVSNFLIELVPSPRLVQVLPSYSPLILLPGGCVLKLEEGRLSYCWGNEEICRKYIKDLEKVPKHVKECTKAYIGWLEERIQQVRGKVVGVLELKIPKDLAWEVVSFLSPTVIS